MMRTTLRRLIIFMGFTVLLFSRTVASGPLEPQKVPRKIADWVDWVLFDVPDHPCPIVESEPVCVWLGRLTLTLNDTGGEFTQELFADREIAAALPGNSIHWPERVMLDKENAIVFETNGLPLVTVPPGSHRISGSFTWLELPEGIRIPPSTAMVSLNVRGTDIPSPRRDEAGLLWLIGESRSDENDTLSLVVMRKIIDAIPLSIESRIIVRASGKAREVRIGNVLLKNTTPVSVTADIPARLDAEGNLDMQVRAGTHTVTIVARTQGSPKTIKSQPRKAPWPDHEIWVWQAEESLRQVSLSGPSGIDPSLTDLSEDWHHLPAYFVQPDTTLNFASKRRGEPDPPPDQLKLARTLWMDLDGSGFTVQDKLSGTLNRSWRLDLEPPGKLGHVSVNSIDQLITAGSSKKHGVELRQGALDMQADWRLEHGPQKPIAASGWSQNISELDVALNLPPGWTLLSASGVDDVRATWWSRWDLFSFFFVLIISITIGKLTRWPYGIIALIVLVLSQHETDAPVAVWVSLLISLALLKVLHKGKLLVANKLVWWGSVIWLAAVLIPFSVSQVRTGLFPQVGHSRHHTGDTVSRSVQRQEKPPSPSADKEEATANELDNLLGGSVGEPAPVQVKRKALSKQKYLSKQEDYRSQSVWMQKAQQQDPKATVQTGPGVPNWRWNSWHLDWSGPVSKTHKMKLYLLSPKVNLLLSLLRVILFVLIAVRVVIEGLKASKRISAPPGGRSVATSAVGILASILTLPTLTHAQDVEPNRNAKSAAASSAIPDQLILEELREKLTAQADCVPGCVSAPVMNIEIIDEHLSIIAEVHAEAQATWSIPGPTKNWVPTDVSVNNKATSAMITGTDGFLVIRLERGVNRIVAKGSLPTSGALTLELQDMPKRVTATLAGWIASGIREDGRAENSIQLNRQVQTDDDQEHFEEGAYPPWLTVTRTLDIGIQWQVHTTITRVSPLGSPVVVNVPLLKGESVTESWLSVKKNTAVVSLGRNDDTVSWSSTLKETENLSLTAPSRVPWSEVWVVRCSTVWTCETKGLAPIQRQKEGTYSPSFRPWPGEKLTVRAKKPPGIEGQSTTIDEASLSFSPGKRLMKGALHMTIRTSRGGEQVVTLPTGAVLQTLQVDGKKQPFRKKGSTVSVTLKPGRQEINIGWQQEGGIDILYRAPKVSVNGRAANVKVTVNLPRDRWLIVLGGPAWGPAVLFWGFLLTILLAGLVLGRAKLSPLKSWQWMLLSVGLTQIPVPAVLIIVVWFFVLAWRTENHPTNTVLHNGFQIVLGLWTLGALGCLVAAVYNGLAVQPDMQVAGNSSSNISLNWYTDHSDGVLPTPWVLSLPLLVWKIMMLLWALWLASAIVKWAPWAWRAYTSGNIWLKRPKKQSALVTKDPAKADETTKNSDAPK